MFAQGYSAASFHLNTLYLKPTTKAPSNPLGLTTYTIRISCLTRLLRLGFLPPSVSRCPAASEGLMTDRLRVAPTQVFNINIFFANYGKNLASCIRNSIIPYSCFSALFFFPWFLSHFFHFTDCGDLVSIALVNSLKRLDNRCVACIIFSTVSPV